MKKITLQILVVFFALPIFSQNRSVISIPDLKGYVTLKCDFHLHTIFSDGRVRPDTRVEEAYRQGIDAIALTDHLEGARDRPDIAFVTNNRSYERAQTKAQELGIILIRGTEISRPMPPGHHNAIFLTDADEVDKPDWIDAFRAAKAQNAFIFWNHPGYERHQPDTTLWWPEHTQLLQEGLMHGIEVVNDHDYFPEAHRWCLEKKLTMLGNSDEHDPSFMAPGKHRAMTLVFARSATPEGIREALNERRTAVYLKEYIIGEEKYLKELFENAIEWKVDKMDDGVRITIQNNSDLTFRLKKTSSDPRLIYFRNVTPITPHTLLPNRELSFTVKMRGGIKSGDVNFVVENFLVQPNKGMIYSMRVEN